MEYEKITNLLGSIPDKVPRIITKKWIEVHDRSAEIYDTNKQIRFKTPTLRSDYSDAYIVVKGTITVKGANDEDKHNTNLALNNNDPFISCNSKINNEKI